MKKTIAWKESIIWKHLALFGAVTLLIVLLTTIIQMAAMNTAKDATYNRMDAQTGYYLGILDSEFSHVRSVQLNFFNDRNLVYQETLLIHWYTDLVLFSSNILCQQRLAYCVQSFPAF